MWAPRLVAECKRLAFTTPPAPVGMVGTRRLERLTFPALPGRSNRRIG
jgi:hypothetical protein